MDVRIGSRQKGQKRKPHSNNNKKVDSKKVNFHVKSTLQKCWYLIKTMIVLFLSHTYLSMACLVLMSLAITLKLGVDGTRSRGTEQKQSTAAFELNSMEDFGFFLATETRVRNVPTEALIPLVSELQTFGVGRIPQGTAIITSVKGMTEEFQRLAYMYPLLRSAMYTTFSDVASIADSLRVEMEEAQASPLQSWLVQKATGSSQKRMDHLIEAIGDVVGKTSTPQEIVNKMGIKMRKIQYELQKVIQSKERRMMLHAAACKQVGWYKRPFVRLPPGGCDSPHHVWDKLDKVVKVAESISPIMDRASSQLREAQNDMHKAIEALTLLRDDGSRTGDFSAVAQAPAIRRLAKLFHNLSPTSSNLHTA